MSVKQTLAPGESRSVDLAVPYFALPKDAGRQLETLRIDDELGKFREFWSRELNRNAEFIVPESRIRDAYRACAASNFILIDRDPTTGLLMPHPDALGYEAVWAGDGSVSIQATDRMGYHKDAESMLDYFLARQGKEKPDGDVQSAEGFFSGDVDLKWMNQDGFVLWALAEHYKLDSAGNSLPHKRPPRGASGKTEARAVQAAIPLIPSARFRASPRLPQASTLAPSKRVRLRNWKSSNPG